MIKGSAFFVIKGVARKHFIMQNYPPEETRADFLYLLQRNIFFAIIKIDVILWDYLRKKKKHIFAQDAKKK